MALSRDAEMKDQALLTGSSVNTQISAQGKRKADIISAQFLVPPLGLVLPLERRQASKN